MHGRTEAAAREEADRFRDIDLYRRWEPLLDGEPL